MSKPLFNGLESGIDCVKIDGEEFRLKDGNMKIDVDFEHSPVGIIENRVVTIEFTSDSEIFKTE